MQAIENFSQTFATLPKSMQIEIVHYAEFLQQKFPKNDFNTVERMYQVSSKTDLQQQFIDWRKKHEQALQSLDTKWDDDWV